MARLDSILFPQPCRAGAGPETSGNLLPPQAHSPCGLRWRRKGNRSKRQTRKRAVDCCLSSSTALVRGFPWVCVLFTSLCQSPAFSSPGPGRRGFGCQRTGFATSALCFIFTVRSTKCHVITRLAYLYSEAKEDKGWPLCFGIPIFPMAFLLC